MADFNIEDYKVQQGAPMTYRDAVDHLERIIKFLEDTHKNHFLLGIARQTLEDAQKQNPDDQADFATINVIKTTGSPDMMAKLEDTCDWTANGSNNNFYSMRDVPTAESGKSKFRAVCEEEINKYQADDGRNQHLINAVMASCNCDADSAWEEILGARQSLEDNTATDPNRSVEYLHWALEDLGLEMDYAEEFINDVPYKEYQADDDDDNEEEISLSDFVG